MRSPRLLLPPIRSRPGIALWPCALAAGILCAPDRAGAQHLPVGDLGVVDLAAARIALSAPADSVSLHLGLGRPTYDDLAALLAADGSGTAGEPGSRRFARERLRARLGDGPARAPSTRGGLRGWLGRTFYRTPGHALDLARPGFRLLVDPVLDLRLGTQSGGDRGGTRFLNSRGVSVRGEIDGRVYFQTTITENQARLASWEREWSAAYERRVPGVGFYKDYDPRLFDVDDAVDYIQATGELGFRITRHIGFTLGHGNPRLGLGRRSVVLDDFVDPFLYAQLDTRVWRIHYRNTYAQLQDGVPTAGLTPLRRIDRKYVVGHTLSLKLAPAWEVSLTEQTVLARDGGDFDLQYLNPVILYRAVEQDNGSPDNALFALQSNVRLGDGGLLYGQFLLDEFKFDELFGGEGWWANKYAWQVGGIAFDPLGVGGLEVRAEANLVRPFTFAHRFGNISYSHYAQPLAHPWGASLREGLVEVGYSPADGWRLDALAAVSRQDDITLPPEPHVGANPLFNNDARGHLAPEGATSDPNYGYAVAGEAPADRLFGRARLGYSPVPGSLISVAYEYYSRDPTGGDRFGQHGVTFGVRLNAPRRADLY